MKQIGRYEITGRLGRGAMSTVYKAKAPITGRLVALKILQPRDEIFEVLVGQERLKENFVEEGRIMGAVSHDHVAKIIDCDVHEGQPFMVLEYFAHSIGSFIGEAYRVEDLSRMISLSRTKHYLDQTLKGLERLHFAGIIHRDVKPFNLMITNDDRVKIIDFGLSRVRGEEKMLIKGMQVGSPYYAAPEQERNPETADARADLYSVGVLGYRMLTGHLFSYTEKRPSLDALRPEARALWERFLQKGTARLPENRFESAASMRLALEKLPVVHEELDCEEVDSSVFYPAFPGQLRSESVRIMLKDIRELLGLDELFRPRKYHRPRFAAVSGGVAQDKNSGLFWQRRGPGFTLNWQQAHEYVAHLNELSWEGKTNWRLPTVEEIDVVLSPHLHTVSCSNWPLFASSVHWVWTADHCNKRQAWIVDVVESFFQRLDREGSASVCAVSSPV
ncbi:MAG: serine/threonine protein kinase [Desulforhopalus sp.]|jgi:serine/threonine protein kinase